MRNLIACMLGLLLLLSGCTSQNAEQSQANQTQNGSVTMEPKEIAVFQTNKGTIEIELYRKNAPHTVENFVQYVQSGFYDGTVFHRVIDGFMVQGGGFMPDGNQKSTRPPIPLEAGNGLSNAVGTVAMARTNNPDSATSQFFINVADNTFLDPAPGNPGYAVFGKVASGIEVVNMIKAAPTSTRGFYENWPVEDIVITKAYMKNG